MKKMCRVPPSIAGFDCNPEYVDQDDLFYAGVVGGIACQHCIDGINKINLANGDKPVKVYGKIDTSK